MKDIVRKSLLSYHILFDVKILLQKVITRRESLHLLAVKNRMLIRMNSLPDMNRNQNNKGTVTTHRQRVHPSDGVTNTHKYDYTNSNPDKGIISDIIYSFIKAERRQALGFYQTLTHPFRTQKKSLFPIKKTHFFVSCSNDPLWTQK